MRLGRIKSHFYVTAARNDHTNHTVSKECVQYEWLHPYRKKIRKFKGDGRVMIEKFYPSTFKKGDAKEMDGPKIIDSMDEKYE